jgi:hypothetical protein
VAGEFEPQYFELIDLQLPFNDHLSSFVTFDFAEQSTRAPTQTGHAGNKKSTDNCDVLAPDKPDIYIARLPYPAQTPSWSVLSLSLSFSSDFFVGVAVQTFAFF